jgi:hypothetical protein
MILAEVYLSRPVPILLMTSFYLLQGVYGLGNLLEGY